MIKINLFDYREELNKSAIQKRALTSLSIISTVLVVILFSWMYEKSRISTVAMEVRELEQQVNSLQSTVNLVKSMQSKQRRVGTILTGIEGLRNDQLPATQILFDVNRGVPETIWLTNITQKSASDLEKMKVPSILFDDVDKKISKNKKVRKAARNSEPKEFIQISGHALEDQAVARFVEQLEEIPYFKMVFLYKTEQTLVGKTPVRKFTIYCYMSAKPDKRVT